MGKFFSMLMATYAHIHTCARMCQKIQANSYSKSPTIYREFPTPLYIEMKRPFKCIRQIGGKSKSARFDREFFMAEFLGNTMMFA